jgi:hypothetical protein
VEVAVKKLLVAVTAGALMAACSEAPTAPTAPSAPKAAASNRANDLECRSGYVIAYDEYGNPYCAPDGGSTMSTSGVIVGSPAQP